MSLALDAAAESRIAQSVRGAQWLIELDFLAGTFYGTTNSVDIEAQDHTYVQSGGALEVANVSDSENTADEKITLSVPVTDTALFAATLDPTTYRGRSVRLYLQLTDDTFKAVGEPKLRWQGLMDPVSIDRKVDPNGPSRGRITLPCRRAGMARSRNADGLRLSDAQQQTEFSGDKFYEYIPRLLNKDVPWESLAFLASFE